MPHPKSPLAFHHHILLFASLLHLLTARAVSHIKPYPREPTSHPTGIAKNEQQQQQQDTSLPHNKPSNTLIPIPPSRSHPKTPPLTLHTPRTHYLSPPSTPTIALLTALIERLYDTLAYALLDRDALDAYDLTLRVGGLRLDFYCVAEVLGVMAVRAVVKRLGQLVQGGLTGVVVGGVEGGRGVGVVVALGVEGGWWVGSMVFGSKLL